MTQTLLNNTTLQARIKNILSEPFETNIGVPQGDALSPVLFTIYLELALRELRKALPKPLEDEHLPSEIEYADDTDFISSEIEYLNKIKTDAPKILEKWCLAMNSDKTELTTIRRETNKKEETWRNTKKLGTLLGDVEEMQRRKQLATIAQKNMWVIWSKNNNKISLQKRIMLYNAYIVPILTYNACTWALTKAETNELDAFHRKQLRSILGIRYPNTITNEKLYENCKSNKLSETIRDSRWRMLGHVLRMADDIPAKRTMIQYFREKTTCFRGTPRTTLPIIINKELEEINEKAKELATELKLPTQLKTIQDLKALETIAQQRMKWRYLMTNMHVLEQKS